MRRLTFVYLCVLLAFSSFAQEKASIQGTVIDKSTGDFLIGVSVHLKGTSIVSLTNEKGGFKIGNIRPGTYNLVISHIGYYTDTLSVTLRPRQNVGLLWHELKEKGIGLEELEIFSDVVDENVQPPGPVYTVSAQESEEKLGAQEYPEIIKSTPSVFVNTLGGTFGNTQVSLRGFTSENTAVLINGIPINDPENGTISWFNWGGLNDNTFTQQIQRGLGASKLALNSVGGTINIITKPTEQNKGFKLSYANANRSWQHQLVLSASTGLVKKDDWAVTVLAATQQGDGYRDGTDVESWDYFLSVYKGFGRHQFILTAFGTPITTNQGNPATESTFNLVGDNRFNPAWGNRQGEFLNANKNTYHKPMFILNHHWDIEDNLTLTNSAYYSIGRGGETNINQTADALITNPINSMIGNGTPVDQFQIPWDQMIAENQNNRISLLDGNLSPIQGTRSNYILQLTRNDQNWAGWLSTFEIELSERINFEAGIDFRWYRFSNYQKVDDLLGGDFWIDQRTINDLPFNNLLEPRNTPKVAGDRIGFDYTGTVLWGSAFTQAQYSHGKVDIQVTGSLARTGFQRNGKFLYEDFPDNSLGKSSRYVFNNITIKGGFNYRINGQHHLYFNPGFFTRAPFFQNAFLDVRRSNQVQGRLENENVFSFESGYGFRGDNFIANINLYRTELRNRSYNTSLFSETYGSEVFFHVFELGAVHQGIEMDFAWQATHTLNISGMASIGDWTWKNNARAEVISNPDLRVLDNNQTLYVDGLKVGGAAQIVSALNLLYRNPKFWYIGLGGNFYDNFYANYRPEIRTIPDSDMNTEEKLPRAITLDLWGGKTWKINKSLTLNFKAGINNITDNQFIIDAWQNMPTSNNLSPSPFVQYYFGRTYFISTTFNIR